MSNELIFNLLPFDPMIVPNHYIQLPIDVDDLANWLQEILPNGQIEISGKSGDKYITVYIQTEEYGEWNVVGYDEGISSLSVKGWPKRIAKEIIFRYRHYVPLSNPLFLVIPITGYVTELSADVTLDDIEKMYPSSVSND